MLRGTSLNDWRILSNFRPPVAGSVILLCSLIARLGIRGTTLCSYSVCARYQWRDAAVLRSRGHSACKRRGGPCSGSAFDDRFIHQRDLDGIGGGKR